MDEVCPERAPSWASSPSVKTTIRSVEQGNFVHENFSSSLATFAGLVLGQALFSGYHVLSKWALSDKFGILALVVLKDAIATPVLFCIALFVDRKETWGIFVPPRKDVPVICLLGFTGVVMNQLLFIVGLDLTSADNAAVMQPLVPVWATALSIMFGYENTRLKSKQGLMMVGGVIISVAGAVMIVGLNNVGSKSACSSLLGNISLMMNTLGMAIYLLIQRPIVRRHNAARLTFWVYCLSTVISVSVAAIVVLLTGDTESIRLTYKGLYAVVYAGVVTSALVFLLLSWLSGRVSAVTNSAFFAVQVLTTCLFSSMFLSTPITVEDLIGAPLIIVGLLLVCYGQRQDVGRIDNREDFEHKSELSDRLL